MCEEIPMCHGSFGWFLQEDQAGYKLATTWPVVYYWGGWYLILSYIYIYLYHFRKHTDSTSKEVVHRLASNFCFRNIFRHFGCGPNRRLLKKKQDLLVCSPSPSAFFRRWLSRGRLSLWRFAAPRVVRCLRRSHGTGTVDTSQSGEGANGVKFHPWKVQSLNEGLRVVDICNRNTAMVRVYSPKLVYTMIIQGKMVEDW